MATILLRRDTTANWQSENPVLAQGELGVETDTGKAKLGDGSTTWNGLTYFKDVVFEQTDKDNIQTALSQAHSHANKTLLDALTNSGDGTKFLSDDGTYKIVTSGSGAITGIPRIASLASLSGVDSAESPVVFVDNYHSWVSNDGGGFYKWEPSMPKHWHNAGTIIDPDIPFPATQTDWENDVTRSAWYTATTDTTTTGCWVRLNSQGRQNVQWYGAIGQPKTLDLVRPSAPSASNTFDDYLAFKAIVDTCYEVGAQVGFAENTTNIYVPTGWYGTSETISPRTYTAIMEGDATVQDAEFYHGTVLAYIGDVATEDEPKFMFRHVIDSGLGTNPNGDPVASGGGSRTTVRGFTFTVSDEADTSWDTDTNKPVGGFISAIQLGRGIFSAVEYCAFSGVYDGIRNNGFRMFDTYAHLHFYGVRRDCIMLSRSPSTFNTTIWIHNIEFGYYGRYSIFIWNNGTNIQLKIQDISDEGTNTNRYWKNREYFLDGIRSSVVLVGCSDSTIENYRSEWFNYEHAIYLSDTLNISLKQCYFNILNTTGNRSSAIVLNPAGNDATMTQEWQDYMDSHGYIDLTDVRNTVKDGRYGTGSYIGTTLGLQHVESCKVVLSNGDSLIGIIGNHYISEEYNVSFENSDATIIKYNVDYVNDEILYNDWSYQSISSKSAQYISSKAVTSTPRSDSTPVSVPFSSLGTLLQTYRWSEGGVRSAVTIARVPFTESGQNRLLDKYDGWTLSLPNDPLSADPTETPLINAPLYNSDTATAKYYEIAGAVASERVIRYNYTSLPTSQPPIAHVWVEQSLKRGWKANDIVYFTNPQTQGYIGAVCVASGFYTFSWSEGRFFDPSPADPYSNSIYTHTSADINGTPYAFTPQNAGYCSDVEPDFTTAPSIGNTVTESPGYQTWAANTTVSAGDKRMPTSGNGFYFECVTGGTTGSTEPSWNTSDNDAQTTDNGVVWEARRIIVWENVGLKYGEWKRFGQLEA